MTRLTQSSLDGCRNHHPQVDRLPAEREPSRCCVTLESEDVECKQLNPSLERRRRRTAIFIQDRLAIKRFGLLLHQFLRCLVAVHIEPPTICNVRLALVQE